MSGKGRETVYSAAMTWSEQKGFDVLTGANTIGVRGQAVCQGLSVRYTSYERIRSPAPCRHLARVVPFCISPVFFNFAVDFCALKRYNCKQLMN